MEGSSDFEFQLSVDIIITEETIAVLDTMLFLVSWYAVEKELSDRIYVTEEKFSGLGRRITTFPICYYDDEYSIATGIEEALNARPRIVISPYTITYNMTLGRIQVSNPWTGADEACYIVSKYSILTFLNSNSWGVCANDLKRICW